MVGYIAKTRIAIRAVVDNAAHEEGQLSYATINVNIHSGYSPELCEKIHKQFHFSKRKLTYIMVNLKL